MTSFKRSSKLYIYIYIYTFFPEFRGYSIYQRSRKRWQIFTIRIILETKLLLAKRAGDLAPVTYVATSSLLPRLSVKFVEWNAARWKSRSVKVRCCALQQRGEESSLHEGNRARPISSEILENVGSLFEKIQRKSTILNIRICVREVELKLEGFNFEQFYSSFYISLVWDQSLWEWDILNSRNIYICRLLNITVPRPDTVDRLTDQKSREDLRF